MGDYTFATMPSVKIARSKFNRTQSHNTSFNLGELVVLQVDEVIPGSTHKLEVGSLVRMSTPIAPIMDDIQFDIFSFFVPIRLTWDNWKYFCGESKTAGYDTVSTYAIPSVNFEGAQINTPADDFGLPPTETMDPSGSYLSKISVLPFRGLFQIYNRFFRNQNVEAPMPVYTGDSGKIFVDGFGDYYSGLVSANASARLKAYKLPDYFTSALPYAQKGDPVKIPGTDGLIPVITGNAHTVGNKAMSFVDASGNALTGTKNLFEYQGKLYYDSGSYTPTGDASDIAIPNSLWANAASQVGNTINDLRFAFQLQKALEKDSLYGSRYWELLRAHYSVTAPDKSLQDPQILGHFKFDINIQQVLQTTGFSSPDSTTLGTPGANSVTPNKSYLHTFSAEEHGYVYVIGVARQKRHTYSQGINRMWSRSSRFDFYYPVFANLGAQKVLNKEIYCKGSTATQNDTVFGYQEAWSEYRFLPSHNSGLLNPARTNSLDYWTLADKYDDVPTLSKSFLLEDRSNLVRALVTGSTGPDFIGSFYFRDTCVNPMPLYSIPGFADHH